MWYFTPVNPTNHPKKDVGLTHVDNENPSFYCWGLQQTAVSKKQVQKTWDFGKKTTF